MERPAEGESFVSQTKDSVGGFVVPATQRPTAPEWDPGWIVLFDIFTFHTVTFPFFFFFNFTVKKF